MFIVTGPEFGDLKSHCLLISEALHGLKSSGLRWSQRLADVLIASGFTLCEAKKDIWLRDPGDRCKCFAVHVDDLLIVS